MNNYIINPKYVEKTDEQIIDVIKNEIRVDDNIFSITGVIYKITFADNQYIKYSGKNRSNGKPEEIFISDIKDVLVVLKKLKEFNTSSEKLKKEIPRKIYQKRSPLFAILLASKVIAQV